MMKYGYRHESVRLTGRWNVSDPECVTTTALGSYIEICFSGEMATLMFDTYGCRDPFPHLWIQLDGGAMVETVIDDYLKVRANGEGPHICKIIYKSTTEGYRRWSAPLQSKVCFRGYIADGAGKLGNDDRRTIEFVGDSITEGVLVDANYYGDGGENKFYDITPLNRVYQDDACATYAWLTAEALDLRQINMGYGAVGVTRAGVGRVPSAPEAYPYNYDGSPITRPSPDFILINHGANDRGAGVERYLECYGKLLRVIRSYNPNSKIIALSAFCGFARKELGDFIKDYNEKNGEDISFIDGGAWVPAEPVHPLRDGHKVIADRLVPILRDIIK